MVNIEYAGDGQEPSKKRFDDVGYDLYSSVDIDIITHNETYMVDTGVSVKIPSGYFGMICERSGMGVKGWTVHGGIIDSSYTGPLKVILSYGGPLMKIDAGEVIVPKIKRGDRVAQLIILPAIQATFNKVDNLEETDRGNLGFGSSGA